MAPTATNSGIVTDETSGDRHIPESVRADGSTRKAIKIRPGFRPAEDVELYRARNAVASRERRRMGVPGAEAAKDEKPSTPTTPTAPAAPTRTLSSSSSSVPGSCSLGSTIPGSVPGNSGTVSRSANLNWRIRDESSLNASAANNKNVKRREARKKAKGTEPGDERPDQSAITTITEQPKVEEVDPEVEREKKVRNLKKKLKQAKDLKNKKDEGQGLLPEQIAKVIKINELIRELDALGFNDEGEAKAAETTEEKTETQQ